MVCLDISVNIMVKRLILVLCKSEHYFKTPACNLLRRDVAGYSFIASYHGQKSSAKHINQCLPTLKPRE